MQMHMSMTIAYCFGVLIGVTTLKVFCQCFHLEQHDDLCIRRSVVSYLGIVAGVTFSSLCCSVSIRAGLLHSARFETGLRCICFSILSREMER
jgi:hypothetical protein